MQKVKAARASVRLIRRIGILQYLKDSLLRKYTCCLCRRKITWLEMERNLWGPYGFCDACDKLELEALKAYEDDDGW